MTESEIPVILQPLGKTLHVARGTRLMDAATGAGATIDLPCGGEGVCGKCRVVVQDGADEPNPAEQIAFDRQQLDDGHRLACQTMVTRPMTVEIPSTSLLPTYHKILEHTESDATVSDDPPVLAHRVELPPPDRHDDASDLSRLQRVLGPIDIDWKMLGQLPQLLRQSDFCGTAVMAESRLIDFMPPDADTRCLAVAVDIGTTTLVAMLVDLESSEDLAITSRMNPQTALGDDVLSRIQYATENESGLERLSTSIVDAANEMIAELVDSTGIDRHCIHEVTFSGNTTMQHLLCRLNPRYLGEVPFVPATGGAVAADAAEFGVTIHPRGRVYVLPSIGGFVGGDAVAGVLATGLEEDGPNLLVDIGTNGEIVLASGGRLWATATAAGPAFEGARISHGMRGTHGAIERVTVNDKLEIEVIGHHAPLGICGSAMIDTLAELVTHGVVTPEGRMRTLDELPPGILPDMRRRVAEHGDSLAFELATSSESGTGRPILMTQRDIRALQLASGAIRAGIILLLRREGIEPAELKSLHIAGGFGNFIRRRNAQRIGLLPEAVPRDRIFFRGNTSLAGARLAATSRRARRVAEDVAERTQHVDLSTDKEFQWTFADAMIFPTPDASE